MKSYTDSGTIRKRIEALNKRLDEKESATKESGDLPFWRGRKIISVEQWQSIANKRGYEEVIGYIPNSFIDRPLSGLEGEKGDGHSYKDERYDRWMNDYQDYLYYSMNPQLGERCCQKCVLEDDKDQDIQSGLGLRKIVREVIQQELSSSEDEETTAATTTSSSLSSSNINDTNTSSQNNQIQNVLKTAQTVSATNKQEKERDAKAIRKKQKLITIDYPCHVHNRFKCPYHESSETNDSALVNIGIDLELIYYALLYGHMLTYQVRDYTYKVDFEKDKTIETISKYGYDSFGDSNKRLGVELRSLKQPKIAIESIYDICRVLRDRENLDIILKQYLEDRMWHFRYYSDNPDLDYAKQKELNDTLGRSIGDWFIQIKDDIRIEDLTNFNGITLQEEEENIKRRSLDQSAAITVDHSNDICCVCNKRWACILCVNCDKWICADHWFNHKGAHHLDDEFR
jgi:hypothetical protein